MPPLPPCRRPDCSSQLLASPMVKNISHQHLGKFQFVLQIEDWEKHRFPDSNTIFVGWLMKESQNQQTLKSEEWRLDRTDISILRSVTLISTWYQLQQMNCINKLPGNISRLYRHLPPAHWLLCWSVTVTTTWAALAHNSSQGFCAKVFTEPHKLFCGVSHTYSQTQVSSTCTPYSSRTLFDIATTHRPLRNYTHGVLQSNDALRVQTKGTWLLTCVSSQQWSGVSYASL